MSVSTARPIRVIAVAVAAVCVLAVIGNLATDLGPWYQALRQPSWKPPDVWFGPAWTLIFGCLAASGASAWQCAPSARHRRAVFACFMVNAALNVGWSVLFFTLRRPDWALMEVGLLWLSVAVPMVLFRKWARQAAWWLLPYLVWVAFAATVNAGVVNLNGPFAGA
jgi:translocator protein